ncbi:MAG: phosphoribosyl-AMP cyclohydrolase [Zoogloeaceae bacterium]|jgi:phosphoribosyl-AMP cyclohydrolase|nr:phosphoribosyl-AMP cyclohydrolase [Zoogloeaceae bacterium]
MTYSLDLSKPWLEALRWDMDGLLPVIAQDAQSGKILMFAYMNHAALKETIRTGVAVYWSRSRKRLWKKGEESGHFQKVHAIRADCDGDALLLAVEQIGFIACHTGRESCFFHELSDNHWQIVEPVLKDPKEIYR